MSSTGIASGVAGGALGLAAKAVPAVSESSMVRVVTTTRNLLKTDPSSMGMSRWSARA